MQNYFSVWKQSLPKWAGKNEELYVDGNDLKEWLLSYC